METATAAYKLIKKVKDDKFDVDNLHQYNLLIQIGIRDLQVSIINSQDNRCLLLEDYMLPSTKSYSELKQVLNSLFTEHHLLMAGFWRSVKVGFKNAKFALVPGSLFVKEEAATYLKLNSTYNAKTEEALYYKHINSSAVCVFAANKILTGWLTKLYPNAEVGYVHQSSALIEGVINFAKSHPKDAIYLYVDRFRLHILSMKGGELQYYNQFIIKQFNDYIRYIMLVMKGLNKSQRTTEVVLWGYIGKQSAHFKEFHKYIKNITFGDRPDYLKYGFQFDEVQDHHFFDLYSLHLCD